ncbi:hypothetical protein SJPD1_2532 [Sulfurospirillum diekertiae]|uniref:Type I restriction enzyme R protein C-terminal domain-containing protein n=1 Tax=Sulfurospirillum diekertiae TaxID=1854492 RepID=A0A290HXP3_9BACT|nr:hypothetical protein [Sulfurospirillum diekertiae]ATB70626.1 hypothetical protein SJPD1_2532 [Sulfurospirillum diekertiae]
MGEENKKKPSSKPSVARFNLKAELIEKFINDHLMQLDDTDAIESAFESFWDAEKKKPMSLFTFKKNLKYIL